MAIFLLLMLLAVVPVVTSNGYVNDYDQDVDFECPRGHSISHIKSVHRGWVEDRRFAFSCRKIHGYETCSCSWSKYVNKLDEVVTFQCPRNGIISGEKSYHRNWFEDRVFKYYCCYPKHKNVRLTNCAFSGYANEYDKPVNFKVPKGKVLKGVVSVHHNYYEDRRFKFETCSVEVK